MHNNLAIKQKAGAVTAVAYQGFEMEANMSTWQPLGDVKQQNTSQVEQNRGMTSSSFPVYDYNPPAGSKLQHPVPCFQPDLIPIRFISSFFRVLLPFSALSASSLRFLALFMDIFNYSTSYHQAFH